VDFWKNLGINASAYTDKLFEMIDVDGSGMMDFNEFICILVTYCIFNRDDILLFAFDCFDLDGSGTIDREEAKRLIEMLLSQASVHE
jgi:Ca2+-binding EF-hand superfamily protein